MGFQDSHADRGDTQRAIEVYRDIHALTVDIRKDKEMEMEILNAEIKDWEGEVRGVANLTGTYRVISINGGIGQWL